MATILLVDDNAPLRSVMKLALAREGHRVLEAGEGREAIRVLKQHDVDVMVTDIVMPDQDGLATIPIARTLRPRMKIVVVSGDAPRFAELYLKTAGLLGAHQTLMKPFSISDLVSAVNIASPPAAPGDVTGAGS